MRDSKLSFASRKALCVQLGDSAGTEMAGLLNELIDRVEHLERSKVDVTPIIPIARSQSIEKPHSRAA